MATKVYKYGARPAGEDVREQMRLGRAYYNRLVEAENERRRAVWGSEHPPAPPHEDCTCEVCKAHWRDLRTRMRETPPLDVKPLRAAAVEGGLYWGTYLAIEQAFSAAWKKTDALKTVRFRSWRQGGVIAVQIHKPELGDAATMFRLEKAPDSRTGRRARNGRGRHTVALRLGSNADRTPRFSKPIRFEMHRALRGIVTWVHVRVRYVADREVWSVAFTCGAVPPARPWADDGTVAVDVSWRKMDDGSWRLAYAQDEDGAVSELWMPPTWTERSARADRIRSHRDERLNEAKVRWPVLARVQSCQGAVRACRRRGALTLEEDEWIGRELHLWRYECGCRRRSEAGRRAALTEWVSALRLRYGHVVVKDTAHKLLKEQHGLPKPAQRQGQHAAPGETVETLRRYFGDDRTHVVAAPWTTATCPECGLEAPCGAERFLECERCGALADRDDISTRNMLALYKGGEATKPTARKQTARFAKRHAEYEVPSQC